jgi:tetratricopeptide (TPR) repeat protein
MRPERMNWAGLQVGAISLVMLLIPYTYALADSIPMWRDKVTLYSETLKRSPTAMIMACNLGSYYHTHGDYEKAKEWYQKAIEIWGKPFIKDKSNLGGAYIGVGGAYLKQGKADKALDYFKRANEIIPDEPLMLDNLGTAYLAIGNLRTALQYFERAVAKNPRSERSYNNIAVIYLGQHNYDEAIVMAKKALSIFPQAGEPYLIMGRAYRLKGMKEQAREALLTARNVDPSKASLVESELKALEKPRF